jgi:uncharacterized protein (TIGR02117 family)
MKRGVLRAGSIALALLLGVPLLYALCMLAGAAIQVNGDYQPPSEGITLYLRHNGIHTDLVLPVVTPQIDWRREFPAADFAAPLKPANPPFRLWLAADIPPDRNPAASHVAIGWGDAGFYFDTPRWSDLTATTALAAVSGTGQSVVHVEYLPVPGASPSLRKLVVSPAVYQRLIAHVQGAFARDPGGARIAYTGRGYTVHDTFYAARGHFSPWRTCNEWVREALAAAGVRVPLWAPLPYAMF